MRFAFPYSDLDNSFSKFSAFCAAALATDSTARFVSAIFRVKRTETQIATAATSTALHAAANEITLSTLRFVPLNIELV